MVLVPPYPLLSVRSPMAKAKESTFASRGSREAATAIATATAPTRTSATTITRETVDTPRTTLIVQAPAPP